MSNTAAKTVAILVMPGAQLLDVVGPLDVFAAANVQAAKIAYRSLVIGGAPGDIVSSSGTRLVPDHIIGDAVCETIDTLLVASCPNAAKTPATPAVTSWLREIAPLTRRYGSVCSGAFLLADAGLLNGKHIRAHGAVAQWLTEAFPSVPLDEGATQVRDGKLLTTADVTAGLDLALAMVEDDLGRNIALKVASQFVMTFKPPNQLQFSRKGETSPSIRSSFQKLQCFIMMNPSLDHSIPNLAARVGLSPRHFARLFRSEVGITPAAWVESARIFAARRLLEVGRHPPKQVAAQCGFANVDCLRRTFVRRVGETPAEYRKRHANLADIL